MLSEWKELKQMEEGEGRMKEGRKEKKANKNPPLPKQTFSYLHWVFLKGTPGTELIVRSNQTLGS